MSDIITKRLCPNCTMALWCDTWAEWKCTAKSMRIYKDVSECDSYKKRGRDFEESPCQCEDCLKNEFLERQEEE